MGVPHDSPQVDRKPSGQMLQKLFFSSWHMSEPEIWSNRLTGIWSVDQTVDLSYSFWPSDWRILNCNDVVSSPNDGVRFYPKLPILFMAGSTCPPFFPSGFLACKGRRRRWVGSCAVFCPVYSRVAATERESSQQRTWAMGKSNAKGSVVSWTWRLDVENNHKFQMGFGKSVKLSTIENRFMIVYWCLLVL